MLNEIYSVYHLSIAPSDFDAFAELVQTIVAATREERDTIIYEYVVMPITPPCTLRALPLARPAAARPADVRALCGAISETRDDRETLCVRADDS